MRKRKLLPLEADAVRAWQAGMSYGQLKVAELDAVQVVVPAGLRTAAEWKALGKDRPKYCVVCGHLLHFAQKKFCSAECRRKHYRWLNAGKWV